MSKGSLLENGRAAVPSSVTSGEGMSASLSDVKFNSSIIPNTVNNVKDVFGGLPTGAKNQLIKELVNLLVGDN